MPGHRELSRRELVKWSSVAASAAFQPGSCASPSKPRPVTVMSKFMQFLDITKMAETTARLGFDGVDLCVRKGAHILPERAADDLPKAVETIRKAGSEVIMITTSIVDPTTPHAETIVKTATRLGITHYRWGGFHYVRERSIPEQLAEIRPRVKALAELNAEYGACAMYHTHSGPNQVGASIWDLWLLLKDFNPNHVSINLDVGHATAEGGYGGWIHSSRLALPITRGIAIKDFVWGKNDRGEWAPQWRPLGTGMVQVRSFLGLAREAGFSGPLQLHFEYPLGGIDTGSRNPTLDPEIAFAAMRNDVNLLRGWMRSEGLT